MRESDLYEADYGSNDFEFNDGKVKYIPEKKAFVLISKKSENMYLIVMLYTDGRLLFSTISDPDVFDIIVGSIEQIMNPLNVNKAFSYNSDIEDMMKTIVEKFYNRIDNLMFVAVDSSSLNKLQRFIDSPSISKYLESKKFEYIDNKKLSGAILINYTKQ